MRVIIQGYFIIAFIILSVGCSKKEDDPQPPAPKPSISRFSPVADTIGATVTIYGANFDINKTNNDLKFNGVSATVLTASTDSLTAKVPAGASTGKINISVSGRLAESASDFTVLYAPSIISFSPLGDSVGATVTINGINFGSTIDKNIVTFPGNAGSVQAQVLQASETQLVVKVPAGAVSSGNIKVRVNNYDAFATKSFYVLIPPVISSFSPFAGPVGSVIEITGTNFYQFPGGPVIIRFNGVVAPQFQLFLNSINVTIPAGATTGKVSISIGTVTGYSTSDFVISSQQWKKKKDIVSAREGAIGFTIGNKGYIGLGREFHASSALQDLWEYDPVTDQFTRKADLPAIGKWNSSCFVINNKAYIVGGLNGDSGNSFETWEYDPVIDKWTRKADFNGWFQILPIAFSIGNKGYYGLGGQTGLWEFDPAANAWSAKANFPGEKRDGPMSFVINDKAYVGGGTSSFTNKKDLWEYSPATDTWSPKADCPGSGRYSGVGFSIADHGYIGLGQTGALGTFLTDLWDYNPVTNSWTRKIDFPFEGRGTAVAFTINGKAYVGAGGTPNRFYKDLWEFTP